MKAGCPANVPAVEGDVSTLPLYYAVSQGNQQAVHVRSSPYGVPVPALPANYHISRPPQHSTLTPPCPRAQFILANGPHDVNAQREPDGDTVLMAAARAGSAPIVRLLLDNGADQNIEARFQQKRKPLA